MKQLNTRYLRSLGSGIGAAAAVLFLPIGVFASQQPLLGGSTGNLSQTITQHGNLGAISGVAGTANNSYTVASAAGTISQLYISLQNAPGAGNGRTFTIEKNLSSTGVTCTVSDAASTCTDLVNSVSVSPGDILSWVSTPIGAPAVGSLALSVQFAPSVPDTTMLMARTVTSINNSVAYAPIVNGGSAGWGVTESAAQNIFPDSGTFSSLYYSAASAPGSGKSYVWTLNKNASPTSVTCTVSNTGAGGTACSDTTHTTSVAPGDLVDFSGTPSGTPASFTTGFGVSYTSKIPGAFVFLGSSLGTADSATAARYFSVSGDRAVTGTEAVTQEVSPMSFTMTKLYISTLAPGGLASRTFTLRVNGADTALSCTITGANTTCANTSAINILAGDLLSVSDVPSGNPATGNPVAGFLGRVIPPAQSGIFGGLLRIVGGAFIIR
ncbi:MAG TPA: hypothetical protein VHC20_01675 [Candidatus Paceibacterota bacterium]|nr:hypothetical protein [Candidatus Paceibacterota bacterium]